MKLNLRGKLFAVSLALIAVCLLAGELYLRPTVEAGLLERIRGDVFRRLALVAETTRGQGDLDRARWDALAGRLAAEARGRVTFVDAQGAVLGDSEAARAGLDPLESQGERPEVTAALAGGAQSSTRFSVAAGARLLYAAVPMTLPNGARGAARLAVPLDDVDAAVRHLRRLLWLSLAIASLVALGLSSAAARMLSRALRLMTEAARRMAAGDLGVRIRPLGADEVAELGRALDGLAGSLAATLSTLRTERDLLGVILESMQEGVLVLDENSRMLLVNPALRATLALGPDAEGRAALELIRNADLQSILERAQAGRGSVSGEIETTGPKPRRLLVHAASLPSLNRKPQGTLAVFVDVSEIRRLETLRKDFVANVSHELRTPITAVRSAVDTLRHTLARDPDASERFVDIIDRNAQRLGALVEDLLDLSRIESKEYRPDAIPVSLRAVSEQVLALLRPRVEEKGIDVVNDIRADLPTARADRKALEQVFTNLLDNAIKYCGPGTGVRLRADHEDQVLRVEIADSGPGIEPRHLPRLFERFYRVDSGRSRDMGGTGLGLSIVKHLVEAMSGAIGVVSTPGRGATFWFTLPTAADAGAQASRAAGKSQNFSPNAPASMLSEPARDAQPSPAPKETAS
jgi:two-component system, OmpR family, phosphate regulon sensor histidine kinase PhoR